MNRSLDDDPENGGGGGGEDRVIERAILFFPLAVGGDSSLAISRWKTMCFSEATPPVAAAAGTEAGGETRVRLLRRKILHGRAPPRVRAHFAGRRRRQHTRGFPSLPSLHSRFSTSVRENGRAFPPFAAALAGPRLRLVRPWKRGTSLS